MKKYAFVLLLALEITVGIVSAHRATKTESKPSPKSLSAAGQQSGLDARKQWEASPDGIRYKKWEASPAGKKIHASHEKIKKHLQAFTDMEATVTSVTFQRPNAKSSGPKWLIVRIQGDEYMMQFTPADFESFQSLKVHDKIMVRSRSAGYSPNHPYLILSGDYIARDKKVLFQRDFSKNNGC